MVKKKSHKENPNLFIEGIVLGHLRLTPGCVNATTWAVASEGQEKLFIVPREHVTLDVDDLNALHDVLHNYCHVVIFDHVYFVSSNFWNILSIYRNSVFECVKFCLYGNNE